MGGVVLQVTKARYFMSVKTKNNGVPVSRQCFSYKCHVSNIDFHKSPFRNPYCHQQLRLKLHYALDIPDVYFVPSSNLSINANNLLTRGRGGFKCNT